MAELVGVFGVPHNPLLWETLRAPYPDDLVRTAENFARFSELLYDSGAETLVMVGSDHFRKFFYDNSPAIIVGKAERYPIGYPNEIRTFGIEPREVAGDVAISEAILGTKLLPDSFDFGMANEWLLDHAYSIPLSFLTPNHDLAVVPIHTNCNMPPVPAPQRFAQLGDYLRDAIARAPVERKVAIVTTGHLATDLGGPKQFLGGASPDAEFDAEAVGWMQDGALEAAIAGCDFDRLVTAGNVTLQFLNFLTGLAATGGRPATWAEGTASRYAAMSFFHWDLTGDAW